jgi:glycosyltransferase involved in cell wall biosynthesis
MKVAVVTPTIGTKHFRQCLRSVQNQTYENLTHYIFFDGDSVSRSENCERAFFEESGSRPIRTIEMEENIGKGWYGHRVYAACSFLVNADVICYLDEDNWIEPNHVESLVKVIEKGHDWAYSLRKIYDKDENLICEDNCESLGKWPVFFDENVNHIDTSSFAVKQDIAVRIGHAWYGQWGADRQFYTAIKKHFGNYECTNEHTLCYRLDGNPNSVTKEFFETGNKIQNEKYEGKFPWKIKQPSLQVGPGIWVVT